MAAPSPDLVVKNPPPLNVFDRHPFFVDGFPAKWLLESAGLNSGPEVTGDAGPNPERWED